MFSLELESDDAVKDILIADLWEQGTAGIVETELREGRWLLRAFFAPEADAESMLRLFASHHPRLTNHPLRNWVAESRAAWEPLAAGRRFYLVPEWRDDPAPKGRFRIAINPGLACGTGYHEATQLCLEAIEQYATPATVVLDVGAGAGILSIASALLGSAQVIACDVDPVAVDIAAAAFHRAGVGILLFTGSASSVRSGSAGLIVANISAAASIELAPEFLRCLAPEGRCVASGFETSEAAEVEAALERAGAILERKLVKGQWCALVVTVPATVSVRSIRVAGSRFAQNEAASSGLLPAWVQFNAAYLPGLGVLHKSWGGPPGPRPTPPSACSRLDETDLNVEERVQGDPRGPGGPPYRNH